MDARDLKELEDRYGIEERRELRLKDFAAYEDPADRLDLDALEKSSQKSTINFCPFCGSKAAAGSEVCGSCGHSFSKRRK